MNFHEYSFQTHSPPIPQLILRLADEQGPGQGLKAEPRGQQCCVGHSRVSYSTPTHSSTLSQHERVAGNSLAPHAANLTRLIESACLFLFSLAPLRNNEINLPGLAPPDPCCYLPSPNNGHIRQPRSPFLSLPIKQFEIQTLSQSTPSTCTPTPPSP